MKKRAAAILMASVMALSMGACGSGSDANTGSGNGKTVTGTEANGGSGEVESLSVSQPGQEHRQIQKRYRKQSMILQGIR